MCIEVAGAILVCSVHDPFDVHYGYGWSLCIALGVLWIWETPCAPLSCIMGYGRLWASLRRIMDMGDSASTWLGDMRAYGLAGSHYMGCCLGGLVSSNRVIHV